MKIILAATVARADGLSGASGDLVDWPTAVAEAMVKNRDADIATAEDIRRRIRRPAATLDVDPMPRAVTDPYLRARHAADDPDELGSTAGGAGDDFTSPEDLGVQLHNERVLAARRRRAQGAE
jgi:hypothetical protein